MNPITCDLLSDILDYNASTGEFKWKARPVNHFKNLLGCNTFNSRYAGKRAGSTQPNGYLLITISLNGKRYDFLGHRLAWMLAHGSLSKGRHIDHINGNPSDNRLVNLRLVDNAENHRNMARSIRNKSGCTGVYWRENRAAWQVQITKNYKTYTIGHFGNKDEAIATRKAAEKDMGFHPNHGR